MKFSKSTIASFLLLIIAASMYRVWEGRPFGFAPQIAMAIFGGAVIKDKRLAFVLPLLSMFISDLLYQALYINGLSTIQGFYGGQWINYMLFAGLTVFGFLIRKINLKNVLGFSISGSMLFFIVSNFLVWLGGGGLGRPKTFDGLVLCYGDALAFHKQYGLIEGFAGNFLVGDIFWSLVLFGSFFFINKYILDEKKQVASL
ncbi:MAG TPA: DUF6580 family putative transport protein [Chitinophagaceae bacterium]|nr:DUF6580 family putative transport protein [Chitinophagaceae bacterium]